MSEQRRIDLLFATTVRVLALARAVRSAGPAVLMAAGALVVAYGTLGGSDARRDVADAPHGAFVHAPADLIGSIEPAPVASARAAVARAEPAVPETAAAEPPPPPAPQLDREQTNIARFIAQRYRLTVDATGEFVHHAYRAARDTKIDPLLVLAVMSVESGFNPKAQSPAGAQGLMQVLTRVHAEKFLPFGGIPAAFDPVANIRVGSAILKEYLKREGSVEGALKSYVGAALAEHDGGYGMKVLNARERIAAAAAGRPIPPEIAVPRPAPALQPVSAPVEAAPPSDEIRETREPRHAPVVPEASGAEAREGEPRPATPRANAAPTRPGDV
ncbi:MAG TPA: transglycosylase SLT domain-containing protein [Burkholderiaceae bacterium]|nr:transglycosylase SLT domain-containing protein [Burkholderiaceae bacterium]